VALNNNNNNFNININNVYISIAQNKLSSVALMEVQTSMSLVSQRNCHFLNWCSNNFENYSFPHCWKAVFALCPYKTTTWSCKSEKSNH